MYRFFDLILLFIFSIPILFLFIVTLILCLTFQGRPIFFNQSRGGFKNKKIVIYKFRSMNNIKNKKKITKLGKLLRLSKLDEIPQFYNVLIGELSIVGPRPLHFEYKNLYSNYQKNNDSWKKKFNYDIWYVENKNLVLDIYILFKTFYNLIFLQSDEKIPKKFNGKN